MRALMLLSIVATASFAADPAPTWHSDYPRGRKEASEQGKAVCLVIGSENCMYCRKLEATTLQDAAVMASLRQSYVSIKIDGSKETDIVKALNVQLFPTTVLASADGTIHAILNGYVTPEQMREHLKRTLVVIADEEKMVRDLAAAKQAFEAGDLAFASSLLRPMVAEFKNKPVQLKAKELMEKIDRAATTRAVVQAVRPQALLDVAKQLHDSLRLADAMDVAAEVMRSHPNSPEAKLAAALIEDIRTNPEKLRTASRQADEKAASLQLALSESLMKRGDTVAAKECLNQVLRLCPSGPNAEMAQMQLTKLNGPLIAFPATYKK